MGSAAPKGTQPVETEGQLADAKAYLGAPGARGKLHDIFDTVMVLNLENGAADTKLDSNQQIDNAVINSVAAP